MGANIDETQAPRVPAHELAPPARPHWPQSDRQAVAVIACKALRKEMHGAGGVRSLVHAMHC